jgi:superfamily I DNA/RNA helicase/RecB family exonuclease
MDDAARPAGAASTASPAASSTVLPAPTPFRLTQRPADAASAPRLDPSQQAVVAHRGGPLLVLAGPGTGKTTTLVEAVFDRTRGPGALAPEEILVLTFSRAAAAELRDRIGSRLAQAAREASEQRSAFEQRSASEQDSASERSSAAEPGSVAERRSRETETDAAADPSGGAVPAQRAPEREAAPTAEPPPEPLAHRSALVSGTPTATTFHSFCFALLGQYRDPDLFADPLRLLSAPEQDVVIRELVKGTVEPGAWGRGPGGWPQALREALGTRGFAEELRAVLLRSREIGLAPEQLAAFAARAGRADWSAAAAFFEEYLDVADARGVLDYAELVHRAVLLAESDEVRAAIRSRYRAVFVDEYQDTDPAQVRLLRALAGDGRELVVVGDPDQSIYAFRGAEVNGILDFPEQFPRADGRAADITVLDTSRRAGPVLLNASRELARRMPITRLPAEQVRKHRRLLSADALPFGDGRVEAATYSDSGTELAAAADLLRRAHLESGMPWEDMAVLVRTGDQLVAVRRALNAANVPVEVLGDDLPIAQEPAVAMLLSALRCAADPAVLTPETARALLTGPMGGMDGAGLRRLGRALRDQEQAAIAARRDAAEAGDGIDIDADADRASARSADQLIREAVADPRLFAGIEPQLAGRALTIARLLQAAAQVLDAGGAVQDALWILWHGDDRHRASESVVADIADTDGPGDSGRSGTRRARVRTGWPERLQRAAERGGVAGRLADRDLDAVIALFALAERAAERAGGISGRAGAADFVSNLQAQVIVADILAEKAARGGAVQIATAHKSKGLQWRVVVVAGVQEGLWPDLRRRGALLEPDRIGPGGLVEPLSSAAILAEERRLFYVAVTRAREHLAVSAVESADEEGDQPSRFLRELGVEPEPAGYRRRRPLSLSALVADLRRTATDPAAPAPLRDAAVTRLATLAAAAGGDGRRLFPSADPLRWWGLYDYTANESPVVDPEAPVRLSPSGVDALDACALKWFLERQAAAEEQTTDSLAFGRVFHAIAEEVALGRTKPDIDVMMERLDRVWDSLPFDARWKSEQERRAARRALEKFLHWHEDPARGRRLVDAEREFTETVEVGGVSVKLTGKMDRIEVDTEGRLYVVDFKTGKHPKSTREAAEDPQLGVYQVMIRAEGYQGGEVAGAELVYPRDEKNAPGPTVVTQPGLAGSADPQWAEDLIAGVAQRVLDERFTATGDEQKHCRVCRLSKACPKRPDGRELPL